MFFADMPVDFQQPAEMLVVANAATIQQGNETESYKMGACQVINREADIFPTSHAKDYMLNYVSPEKYPLFRVTRTDIDIQIVEPPQHGRLAPETTDPDNFRKNRYKYYADDGFVGTERFVIDVSVEGISVQIYYELDVNHAETTVYGMTGDGYEPCPEYLWKMSLSIGE